MRLRWKIWLPLLLALACAGLIITISVRHEQEELPPEHFRVYVQDTLVDWYAKDAAGTLMLPFLALAESLGIPHEWQSDSIAHLSFADRTWVFDLSDVSLKQLGSNSNMLMPPPGSTSGRRTEVIERDAYISSESLYLFLAEYMNTRIDAIDEERQEVRITHIITEKKEVQ